MAKLEVDFNCMCVFVPDERAAGVGAVHVLMPTTHDHDHAGGNGHGANGVPRHVVRMLHHSFAEEKGRSMEGWALVLGEDDQGSANTRLVPPRRPPRGDRIVDLSALSGEKLERRLVRDCVTPEVNARVTLRTGWVSNVEGEAEWKFKGEVIRMAHRVTWYIEDVPEDHLTWIYLGANEPPPIQSLKQLGCDEDGVFRFSVYHVTEDTLPPNPNNVPPLSPEAVRDHFRALYALFGITNPSPLVLPDPLQSGGFVHCGNGQALLQ